MSRIDHVEFLDGRVDPWSDPDLLQYATVPLWAESGPWRRAACELSPVLFAYTYLSHHLANADTGYVMSVAEHHLRLAQIGQMWVKPGPHRDGLIAPRGAAKSTWACLILPLWALCYGHRRFAVLYGNSASTIGLHYETIRTELLTNELLRQDFPEMTPDRRAGGNTTRQLITESGAVIASKGMEESTLGLKIGTRRPDLLIGDDLEPSGDVYSPALKAKRLGLWRAAVMPMSTEAAVLLAGTVVMHGSIMHDLVLQANGLPAPPWVAEDRWRAHHFPAIAIDPETGQERSFWARRHSLAFLRSIRGTQDFALNYDGRPALPSGGHWTTATIRHAAEPVPVEGRIISVDTAVRGESLDRRHDFTAVSVVGRNAHRPGQAVVEYCQGRRVTGEGLREWIHELASRAAITRVIVEVNQGGDLWRQILSPLPPGVVLETYSARRRKEARTLDLSDRYRKGHVLHQYPLPELENDLLRWPKVEHDDLIDSTSAGVEFVLTRA